MGQLRLKIYVPYTNLSEATRIALINYDYIPVDLNNREYSEFLSERWQEGESFVTVEHDVIPWPGAIESIIDCPEPWCGYAYHTGASLDPHMYWHPMLGCTKIGKEFISRTPGCWDASVAWYDCDVQLATRGYAARMSPHRHYPGVVHINPLLLKDDTTDISPR